MSEPSAPSRSPWRRALDHPVATAVMVTCILGGAVLGVTLLGDDFSLTRRILGGAVSGAGVGLLITGTKLFLS